MLIYFRIKIIYNSISSTGMTLARNDQDWAVLLNEVSLRMIKLHFILITKPIHTKKEKDVLINQPLKRSIE